VHIGVYKPR
jgi:hypothetical protein